MEIPSSSSSLPVATRHNTQRIAAADVIQRLTTFLSSKSKHSLFLSFFFHFSISCKLFPCIISQFLHRDSRFDLLLRTSLLDFPAFFSSVLS